MSSDPSSAAARQQRVSRQQRVGAVLREETRQKLLAAAGAEFAERGYTAATVARIAAAAGVTVQTLYLAWGSKRELLRAWLESALAGAERSPEDVLPRFEGRAPADLLAELAEVVSEVAGRAAGGWRLYQDAAAVDPEIAADWQQLQALRRRLIGHAIDGIPAEALREHLDREQAADTAWLITSPESYGLLVERRGYPPERFREWMRQTLVAALLSPSPAGPR